MSPQTFEFELEFVAPDHAGNFAVQENDELVVGEIVYFDVKNLNPVDGVSFIVKGRADIKQYFQFIINLV